MWIDNFIGFFSPRAAHERIAYRKALQLQKRKYEGAAKGRRTKRWRTTSANANNETRGALEELRNRARDLVRNDPYAAKSVQVVTNNIVGKGIMPQLPEGDLAAAWKLWSKTTACDLNGHLNLTGLQKQVMSSTYVDGEILVRKRIVQGSRFPLKLQMLEGDFLPVSHLRVATQTKNRVVQGVEIDDNGSPVAYHLYTDHPGSSGEEVTQGFGQVVRVSRSDIAHVFRQDRPGQLRGVSWFAPVMILLRDFNEFQDAQLLKQKVSSLFAGFIKNLDSDFESDEDDDELELEPGGLQKLPSGMDITFSQPPSVEHYPEYVSTILHAIAAGLNITYESLTGDLSEVNFSSARMGWLEMSRNLDSWRETIVNTQFNNRVFSWFVEAQRLAGMQIPDPDFVPSWTSPKREMIDPTKEVPAKIKAIRGGLMTLSDAVRESGKHPDDHFKELQADKAKIDELGLILDTDPSIKAQDGDNVEEPGGSGNDET